MASKLEHFWCIESLIHRVSTGDAARYEAMDLEIQTQKQHKFGVVAE